MVQKSLGRVPGLVIALGALLSMASSPVFAQSPAAQRGLTFVRVHCAQCHAIDKVSDSPLAIARNAMPSTRSATVRSPWRPRSAHCISNSRSRAYAAAWPKVLSPTIRRCRNSGSIWISSRMLWHICRHLSPDAKPVESAPAPFRDSLHLTENRLEFDLDQNPRLPSAQQYRRGRSSVVRSP